MSGRSERAIFWHLVRAQVWRLRWQFGLIIGVALAGGLHSDVLGSRVSRGMPVMMAAMNTLTLGVFWATGPRLLPIAPAVALRAALATMTLFPVAILCGRIVGAPLSRFIEASAFSIEALLLALVGDMLIVWGWFFTSQQPDDAWEGGVGQFIRWSSVKRYGPLVVLMAAPYATPELVPRRIADTNALQATILVVACILILRAFWRGRDEWPAFGVLLGRQTTDQVFVTPIRKSTQLDRLKGLTRILPSQLTAAVLMTLTGLVAAGVFQSLRDRAIQGPLGSTTDIEFVLVGGVWVVLLMGPFAIGAGLTPWLRSLKVLPFSSRRIVLVMTTLPLITPAVFWMMSTLMFVLTAGTLPTHWQVGVFVGLSGTLSLVHALTARFNTPGGHVGFSIVPLVGLMLFLGSAIKQEALPTSIAWFGPTGAVGLIAAYFLNHLTITRSPSTATTYRMPGVPAGGTGR